MAIQYKLQNLRPEFQPTTTKLYLYQFLVFDHYDFLHLQPNAITILTREGHGEE